MPEPIRFWVLPSEEPINLDGKVFVRTYQSKEDAFVFGSDEPVEMVELSSIREELREREDKVQKARESALEAVRSIVRALDRIA
jgi:hypothetical protein